MRKGTKRLTGFSLVELLIVLVLIGIVFGIALPVLARARETNRRANCQTNFRQLDLVLRMYGAENREVFPRIHGDQGFGSVANAAGCDPESFQTLPAFSPRMDLIYPEYLTDLNILICPADDAISETNPLLIVQDDGSGTCQYVGEVTRGDRSYTYLGYMLDQSNEDDPRVSDPVPGPGQLVALSLILAKVLFNEDALDDVALEKDLELADLSLEGRGYGTHSCEWYCGGDRICRIQKRIIRRMITDISDPYALGPRQEEVPMVWDKPIRNRKGARESNHDGGCNVLFVDGHVEFVGTGNRFPASPGYAVLDALCD